MAKQNEKPNDPARVTVCGIGASAGGLEALREFFAAVPPDLGIAYVVVVHLAPEHESHLVELLQPYTQMPVQQVRATVRLEPNNVYVIPPNANIEAIDTHLRLSELEPERRERAPIDHFLRTLARVHDGRAVAVILTGAGSDGSLGLRQIKERGGLAIAQDPSEAEYDSMPRSAIQSASVDHVLKLREVPAAIMSFCSAKPRLELRSLVVFAEHNVLRDPPYAHIDLILCRGLLSELRPEVRRAVLGMFHYALEPDGRLIVGQRDMIEEPLLFDYEDRRSGVLKPVPVLRGRCRLDSYGTRIRQTVPWISRARGGPFRPSSSRAFTIR